MIRIHGLDDRSCYSVFEEFYTHNLARGDLGRGERFYSILSSDGKSKRRSYVNETCLIAVVDRLLRREGLTSAYRWRSDTRLIDIASVEPVPAKFREKHSEEIISRLKILTFLDRELADLVETFPREGQNVTLTYVL